MNEIPCFYVEHGERCTRLRDPVIAPFCSMHERREQDNWSYCRGVAGCNRWVPTGTRSCTQHGGSDYLQGSPEETEAHIQGVMTTRYTCFFKENNVRCNNPRYKKETWYQAGPFCLEHENQYAQLWEICKHLGCTLWCTAQSHYCHRHGGVTFLGGTHERGAPLLTLPGYPCTQQPCDLRVNTLNERCPRHENSISVEFPPQPRCLFVSRRNIRCEHPALKRHRWPLHGPYCQQHENNRPDEWTFCREDCTRWAEGPGRCAAHGGKDYRHGTYLEAEHALAHPTNTLPVPSEVTTHGVNANQTIDIAAIETAIVGRSDTIQNTGRQESARTGRARIIRRHDTCRVDQCPENCIDGGTRCDDHQRRPSASCLVLDCGFGVELAKFLCRYHDSLYQGLRVDNDALLRRFVRAEHRFIRQRRELVNEAQQDLVETVQRNTNTLATEIRRLFYTEWNEVQPMIQSTIATEVRRQVAERLDSAVEPPLQTIDIAQIELGVAMRNVTQEQLEAVQRAQERNPLGHDRTRRQLRIAQNYSEAILHNLQERHPLPCDRTGCAICSALFSPAQPSTATSLPDTMQEQWEAEEAQERERRARANPHPEPF